MLSFTSATLSPSISTRMPPSPSTRARYSVTIVLAAIRLLERAARLRGRARRLGWAEAAEAATVVRGAQRAAARVRDGAEARRAVRDEHADAAQPLALGADALGRDLGPPAVQQRVQHLQQLLLVDGAAAQLVVDRDVRCDRRRGRERRDVLRMRVHDARVLVDVGGVLQ